MNVKHISQPWFDAIISRKKTYECRLNTGFWRNVVVGSRFQITDGVKIQEVEIEKLMYFNNFGDAWFILQENLIPSSIENIVLQEDAIKVFNKYYSFTQDELKIHGIVAMKLKLC